MKPIQKLTKAIILFAALGAVMMSAGLLLAQNQAPVVTGDARVDKLLSQMTIEEKLTLIHGTWEDPKVYQGQAGYLAGIPRLGIPGLRFADGPPGVLTRHPSQAETATMGVAATFSVKDAELNGAVIGREARALGIDVALQPFVNIDRDLEFGRGYNTFGEDPLLTGEMGAAEIRGIQSQHVMAQVKHYVGYDTDAANVWVDDQALHEIYVAPFEAAVQAGVASMMCSYNRLNGTFACGNESSLMRILRDEVGFKGFVTSDWGATHGVSFINAGLDMEMPGPPAPGGFPIPSFFDSQPPPPDQAQFSDTIDAMFGGHLPEEPAPPPFDFSDFGKKLDAKKMPEALKDGTVTEAAITRAAGHVLYEIARFGYLDGQSKHEVTPQSIDANAKIIQKTGEDAAVLLKNEGGILPLEAADLDQVALIGPGARQVMAIGTSGERSVGLPERQVGPLEAMRRISGNAKIALAVDDDFTGSTVPAAALSHEGEPGLARMNASGAQVETDAELSFTTKSGNALPPNSTLSWKGTLTVPHAGNYWICLQALGTNANISIDGKLRAMTGAFQGGVHGDILQANQDDPVPTIDGLDNVRRAIDLAEGPHAIEVKITPDTSNAPVEVRLNWCTPEQRKADHEAAVAAARRAKVAVVFVWTRLNPVFGLPGKQNELVEEVAAANPNTVVVLNTSQPVALPWLDKVKGVLEMWWPGDEGGWATANLLLGKTSPAGRLPVTWAQHLEDYAATSIGHPERSKKGVDQKTTFSEGVDVGYRWFDRRQLEPLFPFGYGLSYTRFAYSGLQVTHASDGGLLVRVTVQNTGQVDSDEVPQVYLGASSDAPADVQFPVRILAAFDRVFVPAGQTRTVTLRVAPRQLQYWSTAESKWVTAVSQRTVSVGASSRDLRVGTTLD
ncbi:MAG: glycoside hydrolase family 3 C-terminal domain-containing protein [Terriglobia bacterium]|jgi:beta-glucosidase